MKKKFVKKYPPKKQTIRYCRQCRKNTKWRVNKTIEHSICTQCGYNWGEKKR